MGNMTSQMYHPNVWKEAFMISSLSRSGPTPYTMDMIPGGMKDCDDDAVVRHKFKMALKKQHQLAKILDGIDKKVTRCLSPCLMTDFTLNGPVQDNPNLYTYTWTEEGASTRSKPEKKTRLVEPDKNANPKTERGDLGNLHRLASVKFSQLSSINVDEVGPHTYDKDKTKPLKGILRDKKSRSRPERTSKSSSMSSQRFAMSVNDMRAESLPAIQGASSEVIVEKIELGGKRSKKSWPPKDFVKNIMADPNRPTLLFLGRFRASPEAEAVEVDYRFDKETGNETFTVKGDLETLLKEEERCKYQVDKFNNNLDEKAVFIKNAAYIFNNHYARIFWNGYSITLDGAKNQRMNTKGVEMNPPTVKFDMSGLQQIAASRNRSKFSFNGNSDEGDVTSKSFVIRGKNEPELKAITITHEPGTVYVRIGIPTLEENVAINARLEEKMAAEAPKTTEVEAARQ